MRLLVSLLNQNKLCSVYMRSVCAPAALNGLAIRFFVFPAPFALHPHQTSSPIFRLSPFCLSAYKNSTTLTRLISIFSQFKNQTKLSAFFTRINQNQSVNCLLYLFFFSFSMQLSIFGFPTQKRGFLSFSERKTMLPQRQLLYHNKRF